MLSPLYSPPRIFVDAVARVRALITDDMPGCAKYLKLVDLITQCAEYGGDYCPGYFYDVASKHPGNHAINSRLAMLIAWLPRRMDDEGLRGITEAIPGTIRFIYEAYYSPGVRTTLDRFAAKHLCGQWDPETVPPRTFVIHSAVSEFEPIGIPLDELNIMWDEQRKQWKLKEE